MKAFQTMSPLRPSLVRLAALLSLVSFSVFSAGCTRDNTSTGSGASGWGNQAGQGDVPVSDHLNCTVPAPGCLCDIEGQHVVCGVVVADLGGQVNCGRGVSVCTNGKWDECVLTGADPVPVDKVPPGFYHTEGANPPTDCDNNPCNPFCSHFPDDYDDPGLADSGTNLVSDGGISTTWDSGVCTPKTKLQACAGGKDCGEITDGCGGIVSCGPDTCATPGWICGGGGESNKCGTTPIPACTPLTKTQACTNAGKNCDWVADGCGGVISCGTCTGQTTCGLGGPNVCGENCKSKSCNQMSKNCGVFYDACGTLYNCGSCKPGDFCGTYTPNVCWSPGSCTPKTITQACTNAGKNCGAVSDGCGGIVNCGTCPATQVCGGGGVSNVCGGAVCIPKTFAQACTNVGKDCGPVTDGCGGLINCGGPCQDPATCGGGGVPNRCGVSVNCTNLCLKQVTCPSNQNGGTTSITGTVYAPNGLHPLPNAVVYVPNAPVPAFPSGITCENCAQAGGSPLVSTKTAIDGTFKINNMPTGTNIPLVIQIGRWRRQITIPSITACTNTALTSTQTRLPKDKTEGDIPKIAFVTGCVDSMECVIRRMGIADTEFSRRGKYTLNSASDGRVHFFTGGWCPGAYIDSSYQTPGEDDLVYSLATLDDYDMVLFPCQGNEYYWTNGYEKVFQDNIAAYVNAGGRAFMSHYNYHWLLRRSPYWDSSLYTAINWDPSQWAWNTPLKTATINQGFTRGADLAQWLMLPAIGASTVLGQIDVGYLRQDYSGWSAANTINWLNYNGDSYHVTFDTPLNVAQANKCGRVVFSDFHVYNANGGSSAFPSECPNNAMTDQEKLLEYMIFDLSSCVASSPPPVTCVPMTCASQSITCGQAGDGCGGTLTCGAACPVPTCTPKTCAQMGTDCDLVGDGCGGTLNCGTCPSNYLCSYNVCQAVACVKDPCPTGPGGYCGPVPVGCGDPPTTNKCPCTEPGETCGGGGITHKCGKVCVKQTCATGPGVFCGKKADGCGGTLSCGCTSPETCGGSGIIDQCGKPVCNPKTCIDQGLACGQAGDGCGEVISCGTCPAPLVCGGGGVPGQCGALKLHSHGYFVRDYYANCAPGTTPFWQLWSWSAVTAGDSYIDFKVQTAYTEAELSSAPADQLQFSLPPGPASQVGLVATAHAANQPPGSPDTQVGAASVDNTLELFGRPRNYSFLRVTAHLAPTSDLSQTSILDMWDMKVDCIPGE